MLRNYSDILDTYHNIRPKIESRVDEFLAIWCTKDPYRIFRELVFCLFTPQSKARVCWEAVKELADGDMLLYGCKEDISQCISRVRFRNNKAGYLVKLRDEYGPPEGTRKMIERLAGVEDNQVRRLWLVENIKGLGYKEASHFLRNIGLGKDLAILDRHILKNLYMYGVIDEIPKSLTPKKYGVIEKNMVGFADELNIPIDHLDFVLWYMETDDIFK